MNHSRKGAKSLGYDYWSRRPHKGGTVLSPFANRTTRRQERAQGQRVLRKDGEEI